MSVLHDRQARDGAGWSNLPGRRVVIRKESRFPVWSSSNQAKEGKIEATVNSVISAGNSTVRKGLVYDSMVGSLLFYVRIGKIYSVTKNMRLPAGEKSSINLTGP